MLRASIRPSYSSKRVPNRIAPRQFDLVRNRRGFATVEDAEVVSSSETTTQSPQTETTPQTQAPKEQITGQFHKHDFQAETKKLLSIVSNSLYTDKEVFVRELISNASDALEKLRHQQLTGEKVLAPDSPLLVSIHADSKNKTLTITDTGIGMNDRELIQNLGSIGHSGSSEFMKSLDTKDSEIIGQFGVGFYSAFMVADKVTVYSRSSKLGAKGYVWQSDGSGSYEIAEADGIERGTKIILHLNNKSEQFSQKEMIERIVKKYSNFVNFDIKLNGDKVNTVKALWTMPKSQISEEDHKQFYQFIAHAYDSPTYTLHFGTDTPINIRSLFYVGSQHAEKYGMSRLESGVSLYCRKVLIQPKAQLLPEFLRFVKGVVDSEDIPLNLSREHLQDTALIKRIGDVLTKRVLKWLDDEAKKDPKKIRRFLCRIWRIFERGSRY